jgi:hypothetical protein
MAKGEIGALTDPLKIPYQQGNNHWVSILCDTVNFTVINSSHINSITIRRTILRTVFRFRQFTVQIQITLKLDVNSQSIE